MFKQQGLKYFYFLKIKWATKQWDDSNINQVLLLKNFPYLGGEFLNSDKTLSGSSDVHPFNS